MIKVIFATGNAGKMREIKMILSDLCIEGEPVEVLSMKEAGIETDIVEDGTTFAENAVIKAVEVAKFVPEAIVMADDSGLEVDYLNKEPGIYSARYLGEDTPYSEKNATIIARLEGIPEKGRSARFVCAIAAALPGGEVLVSEETIEGYIGYEERGSRGFGSCPYFLPCFH